MNAPTSSEIDAAEKVLADAHSQPADGYWRDLARDVLEAAKDVELKEFLAVVDRELEPVTFHRAKDADERWDHNLGEGRN